DAAARQRAIDQIQLVWTSPDEEGPHVRDTSVVVGQLLSEARQSLWISTYSIFNGQEVFLPIEEAWSFRPQLEVGVLFRENPRVAQSIRSKFESLIQNGFLKPLPTR